MTGRQSGIGFAAVVGAGIVVYGLTAYPTITWWDASQYSLAAATLGVTTPPESLLLTLLGWGVTRLPLGLSPALARGIRAWGTGAVPRSVRGDGAGPAAGSDLDGGRRGVLPVGAERRR